VDFLGKLEKKSLNEYIGIFAKNPLHSEGNFRAFKNAATITKYS